MTIGIKLLKGTAILFVCLLVLTIWEESCEPGAHTPPAAERVDISEIIEKQEWTSPEYETLTEQTGLAEVALTALDRQGRRQELFMLQEQYFSPVTIRCEPNSIISKEEFIVDEAGHSAGGMNIPYVEDGDILITFCSHAFGWRNGHAGLVVDAKEGLVLEAQVLGTPSVLSSLRRWERYPSFLVLRLADADEETRAAVAKYAKETLLGVPYHLTAGIGEAAGFRKDPEEGALAGTQCAHLIWYAYRQFGYDLDSDGGWIVTPRDVADSDALIVVQKYGM